MLSEKNYGHEKPALHLLFPSKYDYLGVDETDFNTLRHKYEVTSTPCERHATRLTHRPHAQIKDIFAKIGFTYKIGKFEGIFRRAVEIVINHHRLLAASLTHAIPLSKEASSRNVQRVHSWRPSARWIISSEHEGEEERESDFNC